MGDYNVTEHQEAVGYGLIKNFVFICLCAYLSLFLLHENRMRLSNKNKRAYFVLLSPFAIFAQSIKLETIILSIDTYMQEKIIILDFGSQTTQLIGRRIRELNVYCEIVPYNKFPQGDDSVKGVILSGSPFSVYDESAFKVDLSQLRGKYPILGICYGAQFISYSNGG